jgi:hypothetical protein
LVTTCKELAEVGITTTAKEKQLEKVEDILFQETVAGSFTYSR